MNNSGSCVDQLTTSWNVKLNFITLHGAESTSSECETTATIKPQLASYCKHWMHVQTPTTQIICPTCKVDQHLRDLHHVTELLEKRSRSLDETDFIKDEAYWNACRTWHRVKAGLLRITSVLEKWAEQEQAWDEANPGRLDKTGYDIQSSSLALEVVRTSTPFLEWIPFEKEPKHFGCKSVRFEGDIVERPKRERMTFYRQSEKYHPGRWAATQDHVYENTSFCYESWYGTPEFEEELDRARDT